MIYFNTENEKIESIINSLPKDTAIGEFSGRDSAAAIIKAMERGDINDVLPVASFAGTEYGNLDAIRENHALLVEQIDRMYGGSKKVHELVVYSNPQLWSVINGRFATMLIERFGFYNPCIGCHAYFHILRIPMALKLGRKIIAGEREYHDNRIKVNQLPRSLDTYKRIVESFGVELVEPLRKTYSGNDISEIIGWEWAEGSKHPECVYSGNYNDASGNAIFDETQLDRFLEDYLYPVCTRLTEVIIKDEHAGKKEMIKAVEGLL